MMCLQVNVINAATFRKAFAEWCYCQFEVDGLQLQDWKMCPPCSVNQHSCHIDGNHKVYRFKKVSKYCIIKQTLIYSFV